MDSNMLSKRAHILMKRFARGTNCNNFHGWLSFFNWLRLMFGEHNFVYLRNQTHYDETFPHDWPMGLLPNTSNCGCACVGNTGDVFPATAGKQSRHARAVMHAGIANSRFPLNSAAGENVPGIPGACTTRNFTYLVRGPLRGDSTREWQMPSPNKRPLTRDLEVVFVVRLNY